MRSLAPIVLLVALGGCARRPTVRTLAHDLANAVYSRDRVALMRLYDPEVRYCLAPLVESLTPLPSVTAAATSQAALPTDPANFEIYTLPPDQSAKTAALTVRQKWVIVLKAAGRDEIQFPAGEYDGKPVLLADCAMAR